jgi:hypothetical protein
MKINKKEYGMGGSTMEMYKSGGMLKALLKDPTQREMAKSMLQEFEEGGKITPEEEQAIRNQIAATKVSSVAMPTKEDLKEAYKMEFRAGQTGSQSLEDFLAQGIDDGDLNKLTARAQALADQRNRTARKSSGTSYQAALKKQMGSGAEMGSSYRPGSEQAEMDAYNANVDAVDKNIRVMLEELGLK